MFLNSKFDSILEGSQHRLSSFNHFYFSQVMKFQINGTPNCFNFKNKNSKIFPFQQGPIEIYKLYFMKIYIFLQLQGGCVVMNVYEFIMNLEINLVQIKLNTNVGWLSRNKNRHLMIIRMVLRMHDHDFPKIK
jgi:hypothetical protein